MPYHQKKIFGLSWSTEYVENALHQAPETYSVEHRIEPAGEHTIALTVVIMVLLVRYRVEYQPTFLQPKRQGMMFMQVSFLVRLRYQHTEETSPEDCRSSYGWQW